MIAAPRRLITRDGSRFVSDSRYLRRVHVRHKWRTTAAPPSAANAGRPAASNGAGAAHPCAQAGTASAPPIAVISITTAPASLVINGILISMLPTGRLSSKSGAAKSAGHRR